jgi:transposase
VGIDVVVARAAGLDLAKASLAACVRIPAAGGGWQVIKRKFSTTSAGLSALADWLGGHGIERVGMESTSDYWKPVYYRLEDQFETWVLNARHMRAVPGRKTDMTDAEWICDLVAHGLVRPSFVPPAPIRRLRDLTRRRTILTAERSREKQRLEKVLEDAGVKLSSVATDIFGVSGRAMIEALIRGERDPQVLADLARRRLRSKLPALAEALAGHFSDHHGFLAQDILSNVDHLQEAITRLDTRIETEMAPLQAEADLLVTIPGISQRSAQIILAEIGPDMTCFPTAAHLASWAGLCPGNNKTAGKAKPTRTRPGNRWLKAALGIAALGAARTKNSYSHAQYRRIAARRGHLRAQTALAHTLLTTTWHMLNTHTPYQDPGGDYYLTRDHPDRRRHRALSQLQALGYQVTLTPIPT